MVRKRAASLVLAAGIAAGGLIPLGAGVTAAEASSINLHVGSRGQTVVWVQRQLHVPADGVYGNQTRGAVVHFQRWFHLPTTGAVDGRTMGKLQEVARVVAARTQPRRSAASGSASLGGRAVAVAATQRGKPYVYGATGPNSFDCSGLTQWVYSRLGKRLPRTTWQQYAVTKIPRSQLRPGDLVFSHDLGHVGIYAGYGSFWNAPHTGARVRLQKVWDPGYLVGRVR